MPWIQTRGSFWIKYEIWHENLDILLKCYSIPSTKCSKSHFNTLQATYHTGDWLKPRFTIAIAVPRPSSVFSYICENSQAIPLKFSGSAQQVTQSILEASGKEIIQNIMTSFFIVLYTLRLSIQTIIFYFSFHIQLSFVKHVLEYSLLFLPDSPGKIPQVAESLQLNTGCVSHARL